MINDKPITNYEQDCLNRKEFVDVIVKEIVNAGQDCFVIGLCGKWGTGKTSVLNLVKNRLVSDTNVIINYNPWLLGSDVDIIERFFYTLEEAIDPKRNRIKRFFYRSLFKMGIDVLLNSTGLFGPLVSDIIEAYYESFYSKKSKYKLDEMKRKISERIVKKGKRYIVVIDDIDRLDKDEVAKLFKMIRNVTDFDNLIYLMAYDDDVVAKCLNTKAYNGCDYLQKITNLTFSLPLTPYDAIRTALWSDYKQITGKTDQSNLELDEDLDDCANIFDEMKHLFPYVVETMREEKRVMNLFESKYQVCKNNIFDYDLLSLCIVENRKPDLISWIYQNSDSLAPDLYYSGVKEEGQHIRQEFHSLEISPSMKRLLENMFPILADGNDHVDGLVNAIDYSNAGLNKRICHREFFDNYFIQIPKNIYLSEEEIERILMLENPKEIEAIICKYERDSDSLLERLFITYLKKDDLELPAVARYLLCDKELVKRPRSFSYTVHAGIIDLINNYCFRNNIDIMDFFIEYVRRVEMDSLYRFMTILQKVGAFAINVSNDNKKKIVLIKVITSTIKEHYQEYENPLIDPDFYSFVSAIAYWLQDPVLGKTVVNHFIRDEKDIDVFLEIIPKLHNGVEKDYVVMMIDLDLIEKSNYHLKYNERYMD